MIIPAGADIAERKFDICVLLKEKKLLGSFDNNQKGFASCFQWLQNAGVKHMQLVIEPTGRYGERLAEYFHKKGNKVLLAQPLKFSRYAESIDFRIKSDAKDRIALAQYSLERGDQLQQWLPKTQLELELRDMALLVRSLTKRSVVLQNQLKCGLRSEFVKEKLQSELESVDENLTEALKRCKSLIAQHQVLAQDVELIMTIPGLAEKSAILLVTLIDFRSFKSSRSLACFLGLSGRKHESGHSVKGKERISKRGSKVIRGALFMPARTARVHNPQIREFSQRLENKSKHDWAIQMAVIRKLVTMAWAVVTSSTEYDPNYKNEYSKPI
jgi:transposase